MTAEEAPQPMSRISGLHGLCHGASLSSATVPRFGVQTDQEEQLAKVGPQPQCQDQGLVLGSVCLFAHLYTGQLGLTVEPGVGGWRL